MESVVLEPNDNNEYTVIDLFSGAGGTALGFHRAGFRVVGALDNNAAAARTYARNMGLVPLLGDIRDIEPAQLLASFKIEPGTVSVLVGCPPCQGFTRMRNSEGANDPRNDLVLRYLEYVSVIRPRCVVFENVPGIIRQEHGKVFYRKLCKRLEELGYGFDYESPGEVLNAADYGVPQLRKRVVLIAGRDGKVVPYPEPTHANPNSHAQGFRLRWKTVGDALSGLPAIESGGKSSEISNHSARSLGERVLSFIKRVPKDGGSRRDVPQQYWLECHKKDDCGHADVYGRLALDLPSVVITSGCTNVSKGRFVHPTQDRGISFREAARLQSFPDDFIFEGHSDDVARQIGNAVPPLLAQAIADAIKQWLDGETAQPIPALDSFSQFSYQTA
ncbi:DNA cytosine methyltransferase [Chloroflexi bacterium CFX3]|nr:DNA cytosine methyltransferase [Chloroflexi bacterium CFX3]